jgi:hypothetical protein
MRRPTLVQNTPVRQSLCNYCATKNAAVFQTIPTYSGEFARSLQKRQARWIKITRKPMGGALLIFPALFVFTTLHLF